MENKEYQGIDLTGIKEFKGYSDDANLLLRETICREDIKMFVVALYRNNYDSKTLLNALKLICYREAIDYIYEIVKHITHIDSEEFFKEISVYSTYATMTHLYNALEWNYLPLPDPEEYIILDMFDDNDSEKVCN